MGTSAVVGTVAVLGLGSAVGVLWSQNRRLESRLADLEGVRAVVGRAEPVAAGAPALRGIDPTAAEVKALAARVADLAKDVSRHDERLRVAPGAAEGAAAVPSPDDPVFEEAVRGVVERLLDDDGIRPKVAK